jgi:hypothetical protein
MQKPIHACLSKEMSCWHYPEDIFYISWCHQIVLEPLISEYALTSESIGYFPRNHHLYATAGKDHFCEKQSSLSIQKLCHSIDVVKTGIDGVKLLAQPSTDAMASVLKNSLRTEFVQLMKNGAFLILRLGKVGEFRLVSSHFNARRSCLVKCLKEKWLNVSNWQDRLPKSNDRCENAISRIIAFSISSRIPVRRELNDFLFPIEQDFVRRTQVVDRSASMAKTDKEIGDRSDL